MKKVWLIFLLSLATTLWADQVKRSPAELLEYPGSQTLQPSDTILALQYFNRSAVLANRQEYDSAIYYLKQTIPVFEKNYDWVHYATAYKRIGNHYRMLRQYSVALEYLLKARSIAEAEIGPNSGILAWTFNNIAVVYRKKGEFQQSIMYSHKSLAISHERGGASDVYCYLQSYFNLATIYIHMADFGEALYYCKKALEICLKDEQKFHISLINTYKNLGFVYKNNKDYAKALHYFKQNQILSVKYREPTDLLVINSFNDLALIYMAMGELEKAEDHYDKALELSIIRYPGDHPNLAQAYHSLATLYRHQGRLDRSLEFIQKAIGILRKTLPEDHFEVIKKYRSLGNIYLARSEYAPAEYYLNKVLAYNTDAYGFHNSHVAGVLTNLCKAYQQQGNYDRALTYAQQALKAANPDFTSDSIVDNPEPGYSISPHFMLLALEYKGELLLKKHESEPASPENLNGARTTLKLAVDYIDKLRTSFIYDESKYELAEQAQKIYEMAIEASLRSYEHSGDPAFLDQTFTYMEKNKSNLILDSKIESEAKSISGIPDSLLVYEKMLRSGMATLAQQIKDAGHIPGETDSNELYRLKMQLFAYQDEKDALIKRFEKEFPRYYELKYDRYTASIGEMQQELLDDKTAVIDYFFGNNALYMMGMTHNKIEVIRSRRNDELNQWIKDLRDLINSKANMEGGTAVDKQIMERAFHLHELLIAPLASRLSLKEQQIEKLILIPDGMLGYIPFEVLVTTDPENQGAKFQEMNYLIRDYNISYGYSGTLLLETNRRKNLQDFAGCIAFAPSYQDDFKPLEQGSLRTLRNSAAPLPGAQKEVQVISGFLDGKYYFGDKATKESFRDEAGKYSIIHLAMHGIMDTENPMYSKLAFSASGDSKNALHTYELHHMDLNADLVVLSACETGIGELKKGEGIMSLARGFIHAGSSSVVTSLWKVEDEASRLLMEYFYANIADGYAKDEALRQAKLQFIEESDDLTIHPFFWAGFILIGDHSPINLDRSFNPAFYLVGIAGLLIVLGFMITLPIRRQQVA